MFQGFALNLASPSSNVFGRVMPAPPRKPLNTERRSREYLTEPEVEKLREAASKLGRHGHRDATMLLLSFRHGLRVGEVVDLRWEQLDLDTGIFHVKRLKKGTPSTHPLTGLELRALRRLRREYPSTSYVFVSERGGSLTDSAIRKLVTRAVEKAELGLPVHPHMLRHSCGYKLANDGVDTRAIQAYLGHRSIQHTVRYTELAADRFNGFWED